MTVGYKEGPNGQTFILGDSGITDAYGHPIWIEQVGGTVAVASMPAQSGTVVVSSIPAIAGTVTIGNTSPWAVKLSGSYGTLFASAAIAASGTVVGGTITGADVYSRCGFQLVQSSKSIADGTISMYVQRSLDAGANWDDVAAFSAITAGTTAGTTISYTGLTLANTPLVGRAQLDASMTAGNVGTVVVWGDRMRAKYKALSMGTADTCTLALYAYLIP